MIEAAASLSHVELLVVSQDPLERLHPSLQSRLAGHWRVDDVTDAGQLESAVRALVSRHGPVTRCFGAFEQLQVPLATVRERLGIPGLSSTAAQNFRDKARMKNVLRSAGVPVARHRLLHTRADLDGFVREVGLPVVVKPPAGAGARSTFRVSSQADVERVAHELAAANSEPMLAEEFLAGTEHSLETVTVGGQAVWHSLTQYCPTPLEVLENPWIQWAVLLPREVDATEYDDIRAVASRALRALGMQSGVSHCEWFRRANGTVAISEIAARPPGAQITTMVSRAHDIDFVKAWVTLMLFNTFDPPERKYAVGTAYLRGQGEGRVTRVDGLDAVQRAVGGLITDVRLPQVGQTPTGSYEGEGFIIVRHSDTAVVKQALDLIIGTVKVHLG
jgi:biotin carboxylase